MSTLRLAAGLVRTLHAYTLRYTMAGSITRESLPTTQPYAIHTPQPPPLLRPVQVALRGADVHSLQRLATSLTHVFLEISMVLHVRACQLTSGPHAQNSPCTPSLMTFEHSRQPRQVYMSESSGVMLINFPMLMEQTGKLGRPSSGSASCSKGRLHAPAGNVGNGATATR